MRTADARRTRSIVCRTPEAGVIDSLLKGRRAGPPRPRRSVFAQAGGPGRAGAARHPAVEPSRPTGLDHKTNAGWAVVVAQPKEPVDLRARITACQFQQRRVGERLKK